MKDRDDQWIFNRHRRVKEKLERLGYSMSINANHTMHTIKQDDINIYQEGHFNTFEAFVEGFCFAHYILNHE